MRLHPASLAALAASLLVAGSATADGTRPLASPPPAGSSAPAVTVAPPVSAGPIAARVNGHEVLQADVDRALGAKLIDMLQAQYYARLNAIPSLVGPALEEDEAKRLGLTLEQYLAQEVTAKVAMPTEEEILALRSLMKDQLPADPDQARAAVIHAVRAQRAQMRRAQLDKELYDKARIEILLEPPRIMLPDSPGSPSKGPAGAAVTILEFGDFQCTQCAALQSTLKDLLAAHPNDVRVVFRQMPLQIHEHSREAASLSLCAADQGKFWQLHDWMFANQGSLAADAVLAAAPELGLDVEGLRVCHESNAHADAIEGDLAMARAVGVNTTPFILINGRPLVGSAALQQVTTIVEEELGRAKK